jgi:hypothetical protein
MKFTFKLVEINYPPKHCSRLFFTYMVLKMFVIFICLLAPVLAPHLALAQYTQYKQELPPAWKNPNPRFAPIDSAFLGEDAVILFDKSEWAVNDMQYSTTFKKHLAIQFLTKNNIAQNARIVIPETSDPLREYADLPLAQRASTHRPKYFDLQLLYLSARLIKPDGTVRFVTLQDSIETETLLFDAIEYRAYAYHFYCPQAQVGDVLEVQYMYYLPFIFDYKRLFFHGNLPKQEYEMRFNYHPREYYVWQPQNGGQYTDSIKTDKNIMLTWQYKNLPACMDEVNAQPHRDLPHIQYYIHNKNFGDWNDFSIQKYRPYSWTYFTHDQVGFRSSVMYKQKTKLNKKEIALNEFYAPYKKSDSLKSPLLQWAAIQQNFCANFQYQNRPDAHFNTDPRLQQLTQLPIRKLLREINNSYLYKGIIDRLANDPTLQLNVEAGRNMNAGYLQSVPQALNSRLLENINADIIYTGLLNRIEEPYYRVLLNDSRIARINTQVFEPLWGENRIWAMHTQQNVFYITPPKQQLNYQLNELPFYLENVPSVHIAQLTDSYTNPNALLFYSTPKSELNQNTRQTYVNMTINLPSNDINCQAKVILTGQYATLIRQNYLQGKRDSSINQLYYLRPDQLSPKTTATAPIIKKQATQFPYDTQIALSYRDNTVLQMMNDSTYQLALHALLQHVVSQLPPNKKRHLPYYPDFKGTDSFKYQLVFNKPIKLNVAQKLTISIKNEFGNYRFELSQSNDHTIALFSELSINSERVEPQNIGEVKDIFNQIEQLKNQKISISPL